MPRFTALAVLLVCGARAYAATSSFASCLHSGTDLTVVLPGSPAFTTDSKAFNRRFSYTPAAIVYPRNPQAVAYAITCAAQSNIKVSARSGGHSYAAFGLGGHNGGLVVDLSPLKKTTVDSTTGYAVSQTGNTLGDLATSIYSQGKRALPHGTCPYVGTGGHASFGGYGFLSRAAGLLLDRVVSAQVVLANGTLTTASATSNSDLFWALRGAAPSFGIVTAWTFSTLSAPQETINYYIKFPALTESQIVSSLIAFQSWVTTLTDDKIGMSLVNAADGNGGVSLELDGSYYGTVAEFNATMKGLLDRLPASQNVELRTFTNWIQGLQDIDGSLNTSRPETPDTFFAKSLMTSAALPNATWKNWIHYLHTAGVSTNLQWFTIIDIYGGAISRVKSTDTAYYNRGAQLTFQLYASSPNHLPPFPSSGIPFVNNMLAAITTSPQAAYPNYVDPTLTTAQWQHQYFGANYARLSAIRKEFDPDQRFAFPQSIQ